MAQLLFPDIAGQAQQGFLQGQQMRANRLVGAAMQNPGDAQGYLAQAGAIDPRLALGVQGAMQQQQAQQQAAQQSQQTTTLKQIGGAARYYKAALQSGNPASVQAAKAQIAPLIMRLTGKQLPDSDTPETQAALDNVIAQTAYLFPDDNKLQTVTPGSVQTRGGVPIYSNPAQPKITPQGYQAVLGPDGTYHAEPIPIQGAPNGMGMGQAASGATPGFQGVATSPSGQGVTFNFPPGTPPEVIAAAKASAVANGDLAPGQSIGSPQAPAQGQPQTLAQVIASKGQVHTLSPAEVKSMGLPDGTVAQQKPDGSVSILNKGDNTVEAATPGDPSLSGDAYVASLPDNIRGNAVLLAEGKAPWPTGYVLKTAYGQQLVAAATKINPAIDATSYGARAAVQKSAAAGPIGTSNNAFNTALQHASALIDANQQMGISNLPGVGDISAPLESFARNPAYKSYVAGMTPFATEMARAYKGGAPAEGEIEKYFKALDPSQGQRAVATTLQTYTRFLYAKALANARQYQEGMRNAGVPYAPLPPETAAAVQNARAVAIKAGVPQSVLDSEGQLPDVNAIAGSPAPQQRAQPPSAPAPGTVEQGYRFKGGDPSNQANWEPVQ